MYIQPDTIIYILKDCPLDPTYDHTIFWDSKQEQEEYFKSLKKHTLTSQTYQRVQKGEMRVQIKAESLYDCNYLMFQNSAFGDRWFYAFIKGVEYVNNITSSITFELDVMQTWFFDYELDRCFVEREHSETDNIGDNTIPEGLEQGPYVSSHTAIIRPKNFKEIGTEIIVVTTFDQSDSSFPEYAGKITNGVYSGLYFGFYETASELNIMIKLWQSLPGDKTAGIIGVYMCPFDETAITGSTPFGDVTQISKKYDNLDGYVPRNKKLFTYPYNLLHIYNDQACADFRYELFYGPNGVYTGNCNFAWRENVMPQPVLSLIPVLYGEVQGGEVLNYEERLTSSYYPQCAFNTDVYKQYLAQNAASLPTAMLSIQTNAWTKFAGGAVNAASSVVTGNPGSIISGAGQMLGAAINGGLQVKQLMSQLQDINSKPAQMNGTQTSAADYSLGAKKFRYKQLTIRKEYARMIDEYFDMFGYATHRVKIPNRNSRPHWNYVKTVGCVLTGSIPADDVSKICHIYNNGITFWKNADEVGDYSLNNSPS